MWLPTSLAQPRGQRLADDGGDARRPDERARARRALRRRDAEALVDQQHDADLRRVCDRARGLGPLGVQDGLRDAVPRASRGSGFFGNFIGKPGTILEPLRRAGPGRDPVGDHWAELPLPAGDARVLPVRVRRDHADLDARLGARADQLQSLDPVCGAVVFDRLHGRRLHDLGRRLLCPARGGRLLGRLCDPPVGGRVGLRRGGGDRAEVAARPRDRRAQQRRDGRRRCRVAVARVERLQRRRPVLRRRLRVGRGAQHEPVHGDRVPGLGRVGLHDRPQARPDLGRQRNDRRPGGDHPGGRVTSTAGGRSRSGSSPRRSSTSRSTT